MSIYRIYYHTGRGDKTVSGTLDDAKRIADEGAAYTQQPITIHDETGDEICRRNWYGYGFGANDDETQTEADIIDFGSWGFYAEWLEAE